MKTFFSLVLLTCYVLEPALSQNVGIGVTSPQARLHVEGEVTGFISKALLPVSDGSNLHIGGIFEADGSTLKNEGINASATGTGSLINRGVTAFAMGDTEAYGLHGTASGTGTNYGIWAAAVGGTENWAGYFEGKLNILLDSGAGGVHVHLHENSSDDWARLRFENNATSNFWDVAGRPNTTNSTASLAFWYEGLGTDVLYLQGDGNAILAGTLTQNSDARLKQHITPLGTTAAELSRINGVHFKWKDMGRSQALQTGLIAQEVAEVFPELVEQQDGTLSVNYIGLIPHMLEVIKAQNARLDRLESILLESKAAAND